MDDNIRDFYAMLTTLIEMGRDIIDDYVVWVQEFDEDGMKNDPYHNDVSSIEDIINAISTVQ